MQLTLATPRIRFALWSETSRTLADELWGNAAVSQYITESGCFAPAQINERLQVEIANQQNYGVQYWPMFNLAGQFIGCCGLRPRELATQIYEIGIHLLPSFWGCGYAQEAMSAVIIPAQKLGLHKLFAGHHPRNSASEKMLLRLGFL